MPQEVRHKLGEYYTPDWLAELTLNESGYDGNTLDRVLDPACGSGTFLVLAIQRAKEYGRAHRQSPTEVAKRIVGNIWGFDLNPLAIIATRTNYLFAMGDLVSRLEYLEIPVYLADSVLWPDKKHGQLELNFAGGEHVKVQTSVGQFHVPHRERIFRPRLRYSDRRLAGARVNAAGQTLRFDRGGREYLVAEERTSPRGLWCGSLFGVIRNWLGVVGLSYLTADDPALLDEIIETVAELCYQGVAAALATGIAFDYGHFWEDICFKNGPLVNPRLFAEKVGRYYRRITQLLNDHGVGIVSLDCDGKIDKLLPIWLENGVNTMFPIEVGTWHASIAPWRAQYGRELRGVGGMDKKVFAADYAAVDAEIERLWPLVALGGYIPCPDHRIPPDAKWENVQHYCERMRRVFGG